MAELESLAERAVDGDRVALEGVLVSLKDDVYRLALRMLGHPQDAEDAAQEILIRVMTNLGSFQGKSRLKTWVYRLATNHLLNCKRSQRETFSYESMGEFIEQGGLLEEPNSPTALELEEEVKLGCTQGMVLALDREHRLAYILVDLFELPTKDASEALEIDHAALRKRLSRARKRLGEFMVGHCGLVDERLPCRCTKMSVLTTQIGLLDPKNLIWKAHPARPVEANPPLQTEVRHMDDLIKRAFVVQRSHPEYLAPESLGRRIRELLAASPSRLI